MASSHTPWTVSGSKTVTTVGTEVALEAAGQPRVKSLTIKAKAANTGKIFVGGADVASTTNEGLAAGESLTFTVPERNYMDLSLVFIDASVNGEGVDFYGVKP